MKKYLLLFICIYINQARILAEPINLNKSDANIIGHVIEKNTGEHLPFVTISLRGTTIGTTTDATGHYFLKNLPEGKFIIEAKFIGFQTEEREIILKKGVNDGD